MNGIPAIVGAPRLLSCVLLLLLGCACSSPDHERPGGAQEAATLGTGTIDLVRLVDAAGRGNDGKLEAQRVLEQAEAVLHQYRFEGPDRILEQEAGLRGLDLDLPPGVDFGAIRRVLVRARMDRGHRGRLSWVTRDKPSRDDKRSIQFWLHPGDDVRTYTIEVGEHLQWEGAVTGFRLQPMDEPGRAEVLSVTLMGGLNRLETDLLSARCGLPEAALEVRQDRRRVLAVTPESPVRVDLKLPRTAENAAPELCFAIGLAAAGPDGRAAVPRAPYRFLVRTTGGETIYDHRLDPGTRSQRGWIEARVPLGRYAGRAVGLIFSVEQEGAGNGLTCCAAFANPVIHTGRRGAQPNVLIVLVDALRADRLGCFGHPWQTSPHIDRLRRESVLFRHALASSSWTAPAVASLFTSLHPYRHGVRYVDTLELARGLDTVAERFLDAGWFTGAVSDNLLIIPDNGFDQGFRCFVSRPDTVEMRKAEAVTRLALSWLQHHGDRPFFLYLHYMDPHADYQPRQPFHPGPTPIGTVIRPFVERGQAGGVANRMQKSGSFRLTPAEDRRLLELYDGEIAATDYQVGRLLAGLRKQGLAEQTVVVFVADHGEEFADHGKYAHATSLFDELVRVPLMVRMPGPARPAGPGIDSVVRAVDLGPTLLDLVGAGDLPGAVDARSFRRLLDNEDLAGDAREAYFELNPYSRNPLAPGWVEAARGVRLGHLKLVYQPRTGVYRLFDLRADPGERRSIYRAGEPRSMEMAARLENYLKDAVTAGEESGEASLLGDRQLQQLDALGYLEH